MNKPSMVVWSVIPVIAGGISRKVVVQDQPWAKTKHLNRFSLQRKYRNRQNTWKDIQHH
jgi:hypothetical protein